MVLPKANLEANSGNGQLVVVVSNPLSHSAEFPCHPRHAGEMSLVTGNGFLSRLFADFVATKLQVPFGLLPRLRASSASWLQKAVLASVSVGQVSWRTLPLHLSVRSTAPFSERLPCALRLPAEHSSHTEDPGR